MQDTATEAGTAIRGGQTVRCPWLLLGGVATSVCSADEMATVDGARPGDVLLLTKVMLLFTPIFINFKVNMNQ